MSRNVAVSRGVPWGCAEVVWRRANVSGVCGGVIGGELGVVCMYDY